jgi:signal transduction histidine kinase
VERHKRLLRGVLASHEDERERLALELHDQVAQALTSALLMLPRGDATSTAQTSDNAAHAQELIQQSIRELRDMAVELRPKALDHFGLEPAIARLAADASAGGSLRVRVGPGWDTRLQPEHERDLFRIAQEIVRAAVNDGEGSLWLGLETSTGHATIVASQTGKPAERHTEPRDLALLAERIRLLGGQFHHTAVDGTAMIVADLPLSSS